MNVLVKTVAPIIVVIASLGSLFYISKLDSTKKTQHTEIVSLQGDVQRAKEKQAKTETDLKAKTQDLLNAQNEVAQANAAATAAKGEAQTAKGFAALIGEELRWKARVPTHGEAVEC